MRYFIKTFGCQQNLADSERIAGYYQSRNYQSARGYQDADVIVINTCLVRQKAEDKIYGLIKNLAPYKQRNPKLKIVITGCLVGTAINDQTGKTLKILKERLPQVDEFVPFEEVGFEYQAIRNDHVHAWVPISNGCNNFCTYCIVPFSRGRENSRPLKEIINEIRALASKDYQEITLLGQNVNSYGADLVKNKKEYILPDGKKVKPVLVRHLGRQRIPTLFPYLLDAVCQIKGIKKVSFIAANPWDFSDELIEVIAKNKKIDRLLHLPVQSGDDEVLKKMNRRYTKKEYLALINRIKKAVPEVSFTTDIIVGFPGETEKAFQNTVDLAKRVGFVKAFIAGYSPRPGTAAAKLFNDNILPKEKKRRFHILDLLINQGKKPSPVAWIRKKSYAHKLIHS